MPRPLVALATFGIAFAAALAAWNAILGTAVGKTPGYRKDAALGRVLGPGTLVQSEEGFARTRINSLGMRGPEVGPKVAGRTRILCLGDSFTAGLQVADGQTFVDRLRALCGDGYEFVNGGRDGVGPAALLAGASFYRQRLDPDLVVFELSANNLKSQIADPNAEFRVVREGAGFRVVRNAGYAGDSPLLQKFSKLGRLSALASVPAVKIGVHNLSLMLASTKEKDRRDAAQKVSPELCRWVVASLHETFPKLILVYIGQPAYFEPAPLDVAATTLGEEAKREGVAFLDMAPILEARFKATGELANGFSNSDPGTGHINGLGHRLVAEALAPLVQEAR